MDSCILLIMSIAVLLIDMQRDFCSPDGALYIQGADADSSRIASFLRNNIQKIDSLHITMDCHQYFHIAHPSFWRTADGSPVEPMTTITHADFAKGTYVPVLDGLRPRVEEYLLSLESLGRYQLTIWPPHCLVGTAGFSVEPVVWEAANEWERSRAGNSIDFVIKSRNPLTEHYSAIHAEVPDPFDSSTRTNFQLIDKLKNADRIFVAGEALSHCVANTLRDLFIYIPPQKFSLIIDGTSTIPAFSRVSDRFMASSRELGMATVNSDIIL